MRIRACDTCRKIKMKCVIMEDGDICRRCNRLGHNCKFTASQQKQQQQRLQLASHRREPVTRSVHPSGEIHTGSSNSSSPSDTYTFDRIGRLERQIERLLASRLPEETYGEDAFMRAKRRRLEPQKAGQRSSTSPDYCELLERGEITLLSRRQDLHTGLVDGRSEDEQGSAPILDSGLITWQEAHYLFQLFFRFYSTYMPTLDPTMYTPTETLKRSTILFTAICAVGSRSYTSRPDLSMKLIIATELAMAQMMLVGDCRSAEILQALLIMSLWPRTNQGQIASKSWLYSGIALRTGPGVCKGAEKRNQIEQAYYERFWLQFYTFDLLYSLHNAKQPTLSTSQVLVDIADTWWGRPGGASYDVIICASVPLLYLLTTNVVNLAKAAHECSNSDDVTEVVKGLELFQEAYNAWKKVWYGRMNTVEQYASPSSINIDDREQWKNTVFSSLKKQLDFHAEYARLTMYSIGLHTMMKRKEEQVRGKYYFDVCVESAKNIIAAMLPRERDEVKQIDASFCGDIDISIACSSAQYLLNLAKLPHARSDVLPQSIRQVNLLSTLLSDMPLPNSVRSDQVQMLNMALESSTKEASTDLLASSMDAQDLLQNALDDQYWQSIFQSLTHCNSLGVFLPGMSAV